jgi:hypothetical protein
MAARRGNSQARNNDGIARGSPVKVKKMNKTGRVLSVLFLFGATGYLWGQNEISGAPTPQSKNDQGNLGYETSGAAAHKGKKGQENLGYETSGAAAHQGKKGQGNLGYETSGAAAHKGKKGQGNLGYETSGAAAHQGKKGQGNSKAALASGAHLSSGVTLTGPGKHKDYAVQRAGFVGTANSNPPPPR